jgi:N-acetylglucosamine malate deacetylase 1
VNILVFGAHPDDPDFRAGGVAALYGRAGHRVKFVSVTNGDAGHHEIGGVELARRRRAETQNVAKVLGLVEYQVLDNHDGELEPTLPNRRQVIRIIREFEPDLILCPRPNDYHPDHRYTSILVQDSAYMVGVPFFTPDVPPLRRNPVYLYAPDRFQRPNPFRADVAVGIDDVIEPTLDALLLMESQIQEGGADGNASLYPADEPARKRRTEECRQNLAHRYAGLANTYRDTLTKFYGADRGKAIQYAQAFEVCEYGRQPSQEQLKQLFPF